MTENELVKYKRSTVGFVWQNNARNLLPYLTAWENVHDTDAFLEEKEKAVSEEEKKKRALELLELVGLGHRKDSKLSSFPVVSSKELRLQLRLPIIRNCYWRMSPPVPLTERLRMTFWKCSAS